MANRLQDRVEPNPATAQQIMSSGTPAMVAVTVGAALGFLIFVRAGFRGSVVKL